MTEAKEIREHLKIFHCDYCNNDFCSNCNKNYKYLIWKLCQNCFDSKILPLKERYSKLRKRRQKRYKSFSIVFQKGYEFKILMKTLGTNFDNIQIIRNNSNIKIVSMDSCRIVLCTCQLPLSPYIKNLERLPKKTNIPIDELKTYIEYINELEPIKLLKKDSLISIISEKSKINISTDEIDEDYLEGLQIAYLENFKYDDEFVVNPRKILSILDICSKFSERFTIECKTLKEEKDRIIFKTSDYSFFEEILEKKDLIESNLNNSFEVCFVNHYIREFIEKLLPIIEKLIISIKYDHPIKIQMILKKGGKITLFVAPRVLED